MGPLFFSLKCSEKRYHSQNSCHITTPFSRGRSLKWHVLSCEWKQHQRINRLLAVLVAVWHSATSLHEWTVNANHSWLIVSPISLKRLTFSTVFVSQSLVKCRTKQIVLLLPRGRRSPNLRLVIKPATTVERWAKVAFWLHAKNVSFYPDILRGFELVGSYRSGLWKSSSRRRWKAENQQGSYSIPSLFQLRKVRATDLFFVYSCQTVLKMFVDNFCSPP